jgi:ABC-type phosphate/phosphonate transport system substrate-binding protein
VGRSVLGGGRMSPTSGTLALVAVLLATLAGCGGDDGGADAETAGSADLVVTDKDGLRYCNGTREATSGPTGEEAVALIEPGTSVAFVDQGSASGYYYPATQWAEATGGDPVLDLDAQFAGDHDAAVLAVARGDHPVGVSYDDARRDLGDGPEASDELVVFAYSAEIPNDGIVVAGGVPSETRQQITDAFLAMAADPAGLATLAEIYEIEGLEAVDLDALDAAREVAAGFGEEGATIAPSTPEPMPGAPDELVVALVPSGDVDAITHSAEGLESFLGREIGIPVRAEVTDSYAAAIVAMQTGEAHIGMLGPVGVVQAMDHIGAVPVLQSIRFGASTYHTQWFTTEPETYCLSR